MTLTDATGHRVSGATRAALRTSSRRRANCCAWSTTRSAASSARSTPAPSMTMAHVLKAWLHLLGTEPGGLARRERVPALLPHALDADERERGHLDAAQRAGRGSLAGGRRCASKT